MICCSNDDSQVINISAWPYLHEETRLEVTIQVISNEPVYFASADYTGSFSQLNPVRFAT